jgi:ATP-dependent helicase YprA (DUF1998 family)
MESLSKRFEKEVFEPYRDFLKSEFRFHAKFAHAKQIWEEKLTFGELVNGAFLEESKTYAAGVSLDELPLHEKTKATIQERLKGNPLYRHQTEAVNLILSGQNAVIATGTSSGKTLCYQIPILDDLLKDDSAGLRAIIIYPLNALVNDQLDEWERMLKNHQRITFARFTGQTPRDSDEYEGRLKETFRQRIKEEQPHLTQRELERAVMERLEEERRNAPANRLNHREAIRSAPPHVLVTNFSMLEYLLERPVDAPIFENANLKFLVLDEVHAYRGVQATEIAFLARRLKDRLGLEKLTCVATSATLGDKNKPESRQKVRDFVSNLFGENFDEPNPIYGTPKTPEINQPSFSPAPEKYIEAAEALRANEKINLAEILGANFAVRDTAELLLHDENLYRLRKDILTQPILLREAADKLFPAFERNEDALQALLEAVASARSDEAHEDLLPTRLHYFIRAQDGLHVCLREDCPSRKSKNEPSFFVSRHHENAPEGLCPSCFPLKRSHLVEVVTCRKCGYLFGALQDLGPRRARSEESEQSKIKPHFDSFSTELGWAADSFWSYFSAENDLPFPNQDLEEENEETTDKRDLLLNPAEIDFCVGCAKKRDDGAGDNCQCEKPHLRKIQIFHRQCPDDKYENLYSQEKKRLTKCPNCVGLNTTGLEPFRRFQESEDETGLAIALPLAHFQVTPKPNGQNAPRKLLCFTDHRQRAAAFPSLLEEETFAHDLGRKILEIIKAANKPLELAEIGERLADAADAKSDAYDPDFFLPTSRYPDDELDAKKKRNLWLAEIFSYFGVPDVARESAEDLGLLAIEYKLKDSDKDEFQKLLPQLSTAESEAALQTLLRFVRQRKAFTLPNGVYYDSPAFGSRNFETGFVMRRETGQKFVEIWLPTLNRDGNFRKHSTITDYLKRLLEISDEEALQVAERIWHFLVGKFILLERREKYQLDHEKLFARLPSARFECDRCGIVTAYNAGSVCPRKSCVGKLREKPFDAEKANIIERWVAGVGTPFKTLKSEEHTAQINKEIAKQIEDEFRAEGVNLLSSTTTFEMGINIGDLQKVLLRNAPPSSASYVQRVGRAGRGQDKNAVSVCVCRRSKYDADMWREPARLMSGAVRPPTVFIKNKIIAQRHLNAVAFAKFLRLKVRDEKLLGKEIKQQIRLAAFLSPESRKGVPADWLGLFPPELYLDFVLWLDEISEDDLFQTTSGLELLETLGDFSTAVAGAKDSYQEVLDEIGKELLSLLDERRKFYDAGKETGNIDRAVKNLLDSSVIDVLAKRGFLPRYAFPLDVVRLETGWSLWSTDSDVELSRERGLAIAEFAPGGQVIAHKKVFTSAGLYVVSRGDKPVREWFAKCPECEQIRTSVTQSDLEGACEVCARTITTQHIKPFVEPKAFSIRIEKDKTSRFRRHSLVRQRQGITHFIDGVAPEDFELKSPLFSLALKPNGKLFRYNLGLQNKGFALCPMCGWSEPLLFYKPGRKHKRLRALDGKYECQNENPWTRALAFGHKFESYCLVIRPQETNAPVESLAMALRKGLCQFLDLDASDIGVAWRWQANKKSGNAQAEIILYDNTPGGAGFVQEGYRNWEQVEREALKICEQCACEMACYDCLKEFGNQRFHEQINRKSVSEYLKYC